MKHWDLKSFQVSGSLFIGRLSISLLLYLLIRGKGLITLPLYTRLLAADGIGLMTLMYTTGAIFVPFMRVNTTYAFIMGSINLEDSPSISKNLTSYLLSSLLFSLTFGLAIITATQVLIPRILPYVVMTLLFAFSSIVREYALLLPGTYQKSIVQSIIQLSAEIGGVVLAIALIILGFGPLGAVTGTTTANLLVGVVFIALAYRNLGYFHAAIEWNFITKMVVLSLPLIVIVSLQWVFDSFDRYVLGFLLGIESVGIYWVAWTLASTILVVQSTFSLAYIPTLAKFWQDNQRQRFDLYASSAVRWAGLALVLLAASLSLAAQPLVDVLAGKGYSQAVHIVDTLAIAFSVIVMAYLLEGILYAVAQPYSVASVYLVTALVSLVANLTLIPSIGILGAAVSKLIAASIMLGAYLWLAWRRMGLTYLGPDLAKVAAVATVALVTTFLLRPLVGAIGVLSLGLIIPALWVVVVSAAYILGFLAEQDRTFLRCFLRQVKLKLWNGMTAN